MYMDIFFGKVDCINRMLKFISIIGNDSNKLNNIRASRLVLVQITIFRQTLSVCASIFSTKECKRITLLCNVWYKQGTVKISIALVLLVKIHLHTCICSVAVLWRGGWYVVECNCKPLKLLHINLKIKAHNCSFHKMLGVYAECDPKAIFAQEFLER